MKAKILFVIGSLAVAALACQTATSLFDGDTSGPVLATEVVIQPEAQPSEEPAPTTTPKPNDGNQIDPCSLLTKEQIESVHERTPAEPVQDVFDYVGLGPVPSCRWPGIRLELSVLVPPPGENPQDYYQEYVRRMDPGDFPTGLGDEAWGDPQDGEVLVRQGNTYFMLEEQTFEGDNYQQNLELAALVLQNLP